MVVRHLLGILNTSVKTEGRGRRWGKDSFSSKVDIVQRLTGYFFFLLSAFFFFLFVSLIKLSLHTWLFLLLLFLLYTLSHWEWGTEWTTACSSRLESIYENLGELKELAYEAKQKQMQPWASWYMKKTEEGSTNNILKSKVCLVPSL